MREGCGVKRWNKARPDDENAPRRHQDPLTGQAVCKNQARLEHFKKEGLRWMLR